MLPEENFITSIIQQAIEDASYTGTSKKQIRAKQQAIDWVMDYIDKTYRSHYANGVKKQATEIIIDQGHGEGFCMGNILKYAQRYGKKEGKNKHDLFKVIHYAVIQLSQDHYKSLDEVLDPSQR